MSLFKVPGVSTKADTATVLIAGSAGFAIDLVLLPAGVPPGTMGGLFATTALGAKKGIEAIREQLHRKDDKEVSNEAEEELFAELNKALKFFSNKGRNDFLDKLQRAKDLYDLKNSQFGFDELNRTIIQCFKEFKDQGINLKTPSVLSKDQKVEKKLTADDYPMNKKNY